jgi:hypothetical protein
VGMTKDQVSMMPLCGVRCMAQVTHPQEPHGSHPILCKAGVSTP